MSWFERLLPESWLTLYLVLAYVLAVPCAARAIMKSRTPQGATAWVVALLSFPMVSVFFYLLFGRSKFNGYRVKRRDFDRLARDELRKIERLTDFAIAPPPALAPLAAVVSHAHQVGFTGGNSVSLLVDAVRAYPAMQVAIDGAKDYVLFQFYVFRDDRIGRQFGELLMRKARQGLDVRLLYDEIGSTIPRSFERELKAAGVKLGKFNTTKGPGNFLQVNFRNHRKIVVVDGHTAFTGGLNIGDEYMGQNPVLGRWRDTHLRLSGPVVMAVQTAFAKDWFWSQGELLSDHWEPRATSDGHEVPVLALHTGPVDDQRTALLAHLALVAMARRRLWIATPYMVLPDTLFDALTLAVTRGVDVRILVPGKTDNGLVTLASKVYEEELLNVGARLYRYEGGFLHQKTMVIDDEVGVVGSANLDYRSMFLNFELSTVVADKDFAGQMAAMFERDFADSKELDIGEYRRRSYWSHLASRAADLLAPVL